MPHASSSEPPRRQRGEALLSSLAAALMVFGSGCAPLLWPAGDAIEDSVMELVEHGARSEADSRIAEGEQEPANDSASLAALIRGTDEFSLHPSGTEAASVDAAMPYSLEQLVDLAQTSHPRVLAASREIEIARAKILTAAARENPEFVMDVETPVYDDRRATQLSTRITFPIGGAKQRRLRGRVASASVAKASAEFEATVQEIGETALSTALRVLYLQQLAPLDVRAEQIAHGRVDALAIEQVDGDPSSNFVRHVRATQVASEATGERFASERELAVARADLSMAIGVLDLPTPRVSGELTGLNCLLPPLDGVIAGAEHRSASIAVATASLEESRRRHQLSQVIRGGGELGPLYEDRLGRDDDSIGLRFAADVPLHRNQRGPIAESAGTARQQSDELHATRHEVRGAIIRMYRELELLADQIQQFRSDSFIADQEKILGDAITGDTMTASGRLQLEKAIVDRQRQQLKLEYRFALLRARLSAASGETNLYREEANAE
jgi:hypothetical protein